MAVEVEDRADAPDQRLDTFPALFLDRVRRSVGAVALREKRHGIWREYTWADYLERVRAFGLGLRSLGIAEGDRVAILSEDRPEWVWSELGAICIGATSVGVYPTNPAEEVAYVLGHSEASVVVAEDQEQVDKVLAVAEQLPALRRILVVDGRGLRQYRDPKLLAYEDVLAAGREAHEEDPRAFTRIASERTPDEIAMIVYTSGTTGPPKGAMLSEANLAAQADLTRANFPEISEDDRVLSYLPLCHVAEKIFTLYLPITFGASASFAESIDTIPENLREVEPTIFLGVPRIWEKMAAGVEIRMRDASRVKRTLYRMWLPVGMRAARARLAGGRPSAPLRIAAALGDLLMFRALRKRLGLGRCTVPISGAAPIAPELLLFLRAIGIPVREGWGQTECAGVGTLTPADDVRLGTIGKPYEGIELRIAEDGEILLRGPNVFAGYFKDPDATARTIDDDAWLHTGDVGEIDEYGHVRIVDRMKDIIITAGGKNLSPSEIENKLKRSPYIKEALLVGDRRSYCVALIGVEFDTVSDWLTRRGIPATTYKDLSGRHEVLELVEGIVREVNQNLPPVAQLKKFRLLPKELDQDDGELTATQKVKRSVLIERYSDLIEGMYVS